MKEKAIILFSGGLDSATLLAIVLASNYDPYLISFCYGQKHNIEIDKAKEIASFYGLENKHYIINIDNSLFGNSSLVNKDLSISNAYSKNEILNRSEIPATYVPARNLIFLSFATAMCEDIEAYYIFIGANALDYSGYPDCRKEFLDQFEITSNFATKIGSKKQGQKIKIMAPLLNMTKKEIIKTGIDLGVNYKMTHSCYNPNANTGKACGKCDSCILRLNGFAENNLRDPIEYELSNI